MTKPNPIMTGALGGIGFDAVIVTNNPMIPPGYAVFRDAKGEIVGIIAPKKDTP